MIIHFNGNVYMVSFIDHTKQRIDQLIWKKPYADKGQQLLGKHPGTICYVWEVTKNEFENPCYTAVSFGVSKLFSGNQLLPKDVYKKKEGHSRSLKIALMNMGLTRPDIVTFFNEWHGIHNHAPITK
jgi:hypothetical protein